MKIQLVKKLITTQFPQWENLPIQPIANPGWDNHTFHLGKEMLIRMPTAAPYASQVEKEHRFLPHLAPHLPFQIPKPLAMGKPQDGYPWKWSIYRWLEGTPPPKPSDSLAQQLATFLLNLQKIDPKDGPPPGPDNFYRGGSLSEYDKEMRLALLALEGKIDTIKALDIWETGLQSSWTQPPVWVHGDISPSNLLTLQDNLSAVIDFGQLAVGDPACDLMITWTFFKNSSRDTFRSSLPFDKETWERARAWTLWKSTLITSGLTKATPAETTRSPLTLKEILLD